MLKYPKKLLNFQQRSLGLKTSYFFNTKNLFYMC